MVSFFKTSPWQTQTQRAQRAEQTRGRLPSSATPQLPFDGQAARVTGAGADIGAAIPEAPATRGAPVGLTDRRAQVLSQVARRVGGAADLTADDQVRSTVRAFLRQFGRLDILVHSNGTHRAGPLSKARVADFDRLWAANVRAPFLLTRLLLPSLRESSGQIAFVNSGRVLTNARRHRTVHGDATRFARSPTPSAWNSTPTGSGS